MSHPFTIDSSRRGSTPRPDCDLFCRVVDNYGDIGVCWRLAGCLTRDHGWRVRLWVDDPAALAHIRPDPRAAAPVEVMHWTEGMPVCQPAPLVIEAFACTLPPAFIAEMARLDIPPRWINLEYLSAEDWVEGCHALPSRDPATGLTKHFFFPGFTPRTGGLLRERDLFAHRDAWRNDADERQRTFARLGMQPMDGALQLSLFSYENPSIATLVDALSRHDRPVQLWVPEGRALASLSAACRQPMSADTRLTIGHLDIGVLPFMAQEDYDRLLWHCDLNIVRGEDSFVRAQWAGRPLLWHIYRQEAAAHLPKLDAFLDRYCDGLDAPVAQRCRALHRDWNGENGDQPIAAARWSDWLEDVPLLNRHAASWADTLAAQPDLASQLVLFNQTPI